MQLPRWNELTKASLNPVLGGLAFGVLLLFATMVWPATSRRGQSPRRDVFEFAAYNWLEWFFVAVALVMIAVSSIQLAPLLRHAMRAGGLPDARELARAAMPRTIYELLLGVAATDGSIDPSERDTVANLMIRRLPDVVTAQDLKNWSTTVEPPRDPVVLARRLTGLMTEPERAALWQWCREVADVDGTDDDEHDVLRAIRGVLKPTDFTVGLRP